MPPDTAENPYAAPAAESHRTGGRYAFVKNPRLIANLLVVLLVVSLMMRLHLFIGKYIWTIPFWEFATGPYYLTLVLTAFYGKGIVFCVWIYLVALNSRGFGAQGMRHTPGWSVGWYFIPIMNLFRPYQAMKEIWQISGDPENWKAGKGSPILRAWWILWLAADFWLLFTTFVQREIHFLNRFPYPFLSSSLALLLHIALTSASILLVLTITRRQEALVAREAQQGEDALP